MRKESKNEEDEMTMNKEAAKKSWEKAGMTDEGLSVVCSWIDRLAYNIENGGGRWDSYWRFGFCFVSDPQGSLSLLNDAVKQTSK